MNPNELGDVLKQILNDQEFLDRLAMRLVKKIAEGPEKTNETITQVGEQYFTRHQLERFKKAFIFLCSNDKDFTGAIKVTLKKHLKEPVREGLTRNQMLHRINEWGPICFKHRGKMCGFYASELYAIFGEYTSKQIMQMLMDNGLWIKAVSKIHPKSGRNVRAHILDI